MKFGNNSQDIVLHGLDTSFFMQETRCGYTVSEKMKKVWSVELDLLRKFAEVCEKNHLSYFLDGGTLLGAVRHKGFIPWDDDADVIMPREDYDKLWQIADKEFGQPYFFQTSLSENGFYRAHAQLRNSNTTGFIEDDRDKDINKGIFIDIFPLDNIPDEPSKRRKLHRRTDFYKKLLEFAYDRDIHRLSPVKKCVYILFRAIYFIVPFKKVFNHFNSKELARYKDCDTAEVGDISLLWRENVIWDKKLYDDYIYMPFENLQLRVPAGYDGILSKQYGDYMKLPEDITAANHRSHSEITFDPDTPYSEYFKNEN